MKKLFLFFLTILITITFLFTWNSCTDSVVDSTITEGSSDIISLEKNGKEKPDPDDKALPCDNRVEVAYEFHHYETVTGKIFGIWPHPLREDDTTQLRELRTKWGFNYILHQYDDGSTDYQKK